MLAQNSSTLSDQTYIRALLFIKTRDRYINLFM